MNLLNYELAQYNAGCLKYTYVIMSILIYTFERIVIIVFSLSQVVLVNLLNWYKISFFFGLMHYYYFLIIQMLFLLFEVISHRSVGKIALPLDVKLSIIPNSNIWMSPTEMRGARQVTWSEASRCISRDVTRLWRSYGGGSVTAAHRSFIITTQ